MLPDKMKTCPITGEKFVPTHYNQKYAPGVTRTQKRRYQEARYHRERRAKRTRTRRARSTFRAEKAAWKPGPAECDARVANLAAIDRAQSAQEIAPLLHADNWFVRFRAACRLGTLYADSVFVALRRAAEREDMWPVKSAARAALPARPYQPPAYDTGEVDIGE